MIFFFLLSFKDNPLQFQPMKTKTITHEARGVIPLQKSFLSLVLLASLLSGSLMNNVLAREMSWERLPVDRSNSAGLDPHFGDDSVECSRNWSVYDEHYKHGDIGYAFESWKYVFDYCPKVTMNIYVHGINIVRFQYDNESDPAKKQDWLDLLMKVYDQRIEHFDNEGYVLGRKATTLYQLQPDSVEALFEITSRSIELAGNSSEAPVLQINFLAAARLVHAGALDTETLLEIFGRSLEIIDHNLALDPEDKGYYQNSRNSILTLFKPFGTCENLVGIYEKPFNEGLDDADQLKRIAQLLDQSGCLDSELYFRITERLYQIQPDVALAAMLGRLENARGNNDAAIRYLQEAANLYNDNGAADADNLFRTYWLMADISYRQMHRPSKARDYALKAHEVKPTDGRPLVLIGEMYVASVNECGTDEFAKKAVFWAACDKFIQAANAAQDPEVRDKARQLADAYRAYFPNNEEIFFYGYNVGESFRVECWISENTSIRAR